MFNPPVTEDSVLQTCARIAKHGQYYHVNIYRYGEENKRKTCFALKKQGKLKQGPIYNKLYSFYRPEDGEIINKKKHELASDMRRIYRKNCRTMIEWGRKEQKETGVISRYYITEFWKNKHLSWHYTGDQE